MKIDEEGPISSDDDDEENLDGPSHNPSAPSGELFDISTTVDPGYVISLIRKLIPVDVGCNKESGDGLSNTNNPEDGLVSSSRNGVMHSSENGTEGMTEGLDGQPSNEELSVGEQAWEEYGCVLWDLSASKTHAELMVKNLVLEVLVANLTVQQSDRAIEISIGIIGNLACHEALTKDIIATNGLVELIVKQLFVDDAQCLCEAFRLLSVGLRSSESYAWASALQSENVLCRILWIAENSLNPKLIEKCVELLLDIVESSEEFLGGLLQPLMKMGLPSILISLLDYEISNLTTERLPILDVILRAIEAISVMDMHSQEISSNKKLFQLICDLLKLPDKAEAANSCVTAAVLIANILSDVPEFASEISSDMTFLEGLLDIFPFASDDLEARSAIWNIMAQLLSQVREGEMSTSALLPYVSLLSSKSDLIEDDLLERQLDGLKSKARTKALTRIISILNQWIVSKDDSEQTDVDVDTATEDLKREKLAQIEDEESYISNQPTSGWNQTDS